MSGDAELRIVVNPEGMDADIGRSFSRAVLWHAVDRVLCTAGICSALSAVRPPDRLILMDGERVVAGCGLAYRLLRTPDGTVHPVSVVVAACTVPG